MTTLFAHIRLADIHQDVARNIVSLRESQDLFDDLTAAYATALYKLKSFK